MKMTRDSSNLLCRKGEAKYDSGCPYYKFLFDDLLYSSPFYDHYCTLRYTIDIAGSDYDFCNHEDHNNCPIFLNEMARKQKQMVNLEGAD